MIHNAICLMELLDVNFASTAGMTRFQLHLGPLSFGSKHDPSGVC
jgi:hypothetical protein